MKMPPPVLETPSGRHITEVTAMPNHFTRVERTCQSCGQMFLVVRCRASTQRFCSRACQAEGNSGDANPRWSGGRSVNHQGYIRILLPTGKRVLEHRYVMEQHLGRALRSGEIVHHINKDRQDNRLENLSLLTESAHMTLHGAERKPTTWAHGYSCCIDCGRSDRKHAAHGRCPVCYMRHRRGSLRGSTDNDTFTDKPT